MDMIYTKSWVLHIQFDLQVSLKLSRRTTIDIFIDCHSSYVQTGDL